MKRIVLYKILFLIELIIESFLLLNIIIQFFKLNLGFSDNPLFLIYLLTNFIIILQINNNLSKIRNIAVSDKSFYRFGCILLNAVQLTLCIIYH